MKAAEKPLILVVDDHPTNLQVAGQTLSTKFDCNLAFASSGEEALVAIGETQPNLILLDITMPGLNGLDTCKQIKGNPGTAHIPIIFLTARTEPAHIEAGFSVGAADYITKPFNGVELVARVKAQLQAADCAQIIARQNRDLRHIIQILCHDLANPIGAMQSLLELMDNPLDREELFPHLSSLTDKSMELISLVRTLRSLEGKGETLALQAVNLKHACVTAQKILHNRFKEKNIKLDLQVDPSHLIMAHPVALANSVICNLLTNAIKFSHPGSTIRIHSMRQGDNHFVLSIEDEGVGIPSVMLAKLFDVESQCGRPGTEGEESTGFGMLLVKRFMEIFAGEIHVRSRDIDESPEAHGTTVKLHFPSA